MRAAAVLAFLSAFGIPAAAQVYVGSSSNGTIVLSNFPSADAPKELLSEAGAPPRDTAVHLPAPPSVAGSNAADLNAIVLRVAPPATDPTSPTRYGQLYTYVFDTSSGVPTETIAVPSGLVGLHTVDIAARTLNLISPGDPFPPNLDFLGFKDHPGVCFVCHGGKPKSLTSTGAYPAKGNVSGFRFLPLDVRSLNFTSNLGPDQPALPTSKAFTDRKNQEIPLRAYNAAVLKTVRARPRLDQQNVLREPHLAEVIKGWYASFPDDQTMSASEQRDFIPKGWRELANGGTAPAGSEHLYMTVVAPSCRACHFNREFDLDFGTVANFDSYKEDILESTLNPFCRADRPRAGSRPMPLAHLTYQRFWEANTGMKILPSGADGPLMLQNTADLLAQHFGFGGVVDYCAKRR